MTFNIKIHVLDHAEYTINHLQNFKNEPLHFNTSVDTAILINSGYSTQDKIDEVMKNILNNLYIKLMCVREKNGVYNNKKGEEIQKYRNRDITFDKVLMVYHNRHFDASKSVNPHLHLLSDKDVRLGKDFCYLKNALREEAIKYNIKFNFMENKQVTGLNKGQQQALKSLSWMMNKGDMDKIKQYFTSPNKLEEHLDWLVIQYKNTQNLSYFIKTISIVNKRLKELDINFEYKGVKLRENIFFFLSDSQKEKLDFLKKGEPVEIDLNNVLDREILKVSYGFNSDVMNVLCDKFDIKNISKELLNVIDTHTIKINSKKKKNNFRDMVIADIKSAINMAKNEKELKQILLDSTSYKKVSTKMEKSRDGKRKKVGLNLVTGRNAKIFVSFSELNTTWSNITAILMKNTKANEKSEKLVSKITDYKPKIDPVAESFEKYEYRVKILLVFFVKEKINSASDIQKIEALAKKYDTVDRSVMYDITTFKNADETIASYKNKIVLKAYKSVEESVSSMLDIAVLKGWELDLLIISGDDAFVAESKLQIFERLNPPGDKRGKTRGVSKKYKK